MNTHTFELKNPTIGLALSGGGIRAAVFHLGVLRYLAEHGLLERVKYISSVSGGSLLIGLVFRYANYSWPSSDKFQTDTYDKVKNVLLGPNIQMRYIARLILFPWNWFRFAFRANVMAETISAAWDIRDCLKKLPSSPVWVINGTTMETGRRWRFRIETPIGQPHFFEMGDGAVGYTNADDFPIASAMATSAAFPGGISPLKISVRGRAWSLPDFNNKGHTSQKVEPKYCSYHVADGGVYDNLGLEPLYDISVGNIRADSGCNYLVVSDAGAPLQIKRWHWLSQVLGFSMRTIDIMTTATRNLRVRDLVRFFIANPHTGFLANMSETSEDALARARKRGIVIPPDLESYLFLSKSDSLAVASYKTTLVPPNPVDFKKIEQHGYEVAMIQFSLYG